MTRATTRAATGLRLLAVILALSALGHTLGTAVPKAARGMREAVVLRRCRPSASR